MTPTGKTTVTVETEGGNTTTTSTYPRYPWIVMHDLVNQWEAEGWRYSIRHHPDNAIALTRYDDDGTIRERITLTEEEA